ncbi:MAG: T9SS type A sorting domain-containing protein [Candidatus Kapabacteria bacterium]|nr:T9SS type A sorting domain-containing protein [Candidatus Kapabacteria bacterium]
MFAYAPRMAVIAYIAIVCLSATHPLFSQAVGTFPLVGNSDSRAVDFVADVDNRSVLALFSNGQCDRIDLENGKVEGLKLPTGVGFQWVCADSSGWWGLAFGGDLYHSSELSEWRRVKSGIGCMYSDAMNNVYAYTGEAVEQIHWASGDVAHRLVTPVPLAIPASAMVVRGDTVILSPVTDTDLVVVSRGDVRLINGVKFLKAIDLGGGQQILTDYRYTYRLRGTNKSTISRDILPGYLQFALGMYRGLENGSPIVCLSGVQSLGPPLKRVFGIIKEDTTIALDDLNDTIHTTEHFAVLGPSVLRRYENGEVSVSRSGRVYVGDSTDRRGLFLDFRVLGSYPGGIRGVQTYTTKVNQQRKQQRVVGYFESDKLDTVDIDTSTIVESYLENEDGVGVLVTRQGVFRKTSTTKFVRVPVDLFELGFSRALPICVDDSIFVVPNSGSHIAISRDAGITWKKHVVRGLRNYPVSIHSDGKTLVFSSKYEIAIADVQDQGDTIGSRFYRPTNASPLGLLNIRDSIVTIFRTDHSRGLLDSVDRVWLVRLYANGDSDSTSVMLPKTLPAYWSVLRGATFGDTVCLYAHAFYFSFYISIVGNRIIDYVPNADLTMLSIANVDSYLIRVRSVGTVELCNNTDGVRFQITYTPKDTATSVVEQNISHYYVTSVHPNPASGLITAELGKFATADKSTLRLELWTVNGELVRDYSKELPKFGSGPEQALVTLDVSTVAQGMYLLVIKSAQSTNAYKVAISR